MRLKAILNSYHHALDALFGVEEVDAFFNILIEHYLGLKRIHLVLNPEYEINTTEAHKLINALNDLKLEKPIQYIIGETEFYGLPFHVNSYTLIPRPETEMLVACVLDDITSNAVTKSINSLDIGTGSGCIAITLGKHLKNAKIFALDISEDALKMAKLNAKLNAVDVTFIQGDILNFHDSELVSMSHKFDVIVSNPPYVRELEKAQMKPNVLNNEPHLALFVADTNPLQFYRAICEFAQLKLEDHGMLYFEINEYLGREMIELLQEFGFKNIELKNDMFGKDRIIKGMK